MVFTLTNNSYKFLTLNLIRSIQEAGAPWKLAVFCADTPSYNFFARENIPCRKHPSMIPDMGPEIMAFGTKNFQTLNRKKLELLAALCATPEVKYGVYMDGDICVYKDFLPDLLERLEAGAAGAPAVGILMQCDEHNRVDCSGNSAPGACTNPCSGLIAWKHGAVDPVIFKVQEDTLPLWKEKPEDQVFIQKMIRRTGTPLLTLPRELYPNGMFASLHAEGNPRKGASMLLHYNYLVGNFKKRKMKANGDWRIPY